MDSLITLAQIRAEVGRLAALIQAGPDSLPTYGSSKDSARPHVEVDAAGYHLVVVERGQELSRHTTSDLDDLLYRVFEAITFGLASEYELAHRAQGRDFRRIVFRRQVKLLTQLSGAWGRRAAARHRTILRQHPFNDPER